MYLLLSYTSDKFINAEINKAWLQQAICARTLVDNGAAVYHPKLFNSDECTDLVNDNVNLGNMYTFSNDVSLTCHEYA